VITGGTSVNSVPFESKMEVDMRSVDPLRLDTMENILKSSVYRALGEQNARARIGDSLTLELIRIGDRPSGELSPELPLIQRALASTASFGKAPRLTRGSTNSNIPISLGIPAVTIGRGGKGANAHALNEWWLNDRGFEATQLALLLLVAEAGLSPE
jgi:acetylornithine deacetylase/succinyl-diaminopimelate desuccinylase-like protein